MNMIADILPLANVVADMDADGKRSLLEQIGALFEDSTRLPRAKVVDSLLAREKLGSTAMGQGIAIPHGRIKGLRAAAGAFVRLKKPIPFDAPDGLPVTLVFALLVPEQANEMHLLILGELAQLLSDQATREQLLRLTDVAGIHRLLSCWPA
ncbi:MAG: PTS sugar transporter subunit IIA [Sulfuricellaceae bacterium]